jgi:hypothetical protein
MLFNTLALFRARVFYFKVKSNNYILDYNSREAKNRIPATFKIFGLTIIIYEILRKVVAPTIISCGYPYVNMRNPADAMRQHIQFNKN